MGTRYQIQQESLEEGQRYIGRSLANIGYVQLLQGNFSDSEKSLLQGYSILKDASGLQDSHTRQVIKDLLQLYEKLNQPDQKATFEKLLQE